MGESDRSAKESPCGSENSGMEGDEASVAAGGGRQDDQKKVRVGGIAFEPVMDEDAGSRSS